MGRGLRYPLRPEGADKHRQKKRDKGYDYVNVTVAGKNTAYARTRADNRPLLLLASASHGLIFKLALGPVFALAIVHASVDY